MEQPPAEPIEVKVVATTPKRVAGWVYIRAMFGGYWNQFSWAVLGVGMIFVWTHVLKADVDKWLYFSGDLTTVRAHINMMPEHGKGEVVKVGPNDVQKIKYMYTGSDGTRYEASDELLGTNLTSKDMVDIEFPTDSPSHSRVKAAVRYTRGRTNEPEITAVRRAKLPPTAALWALVPIVGLLAVFVGRWRGRRVLTRIRTGPARTPASGVVLAVAALIIPAATIVGHAVYAFLYFSL